MPLSEREKLLLIVLGLTSTLFILEKTKVISWLTPDRGKQYDPYFEAAEIRFGLPRGMLSRVAYQESRYNPSAVSPAGAIGLMQFMPATAKELGIDPFNPYQSITGAAKYLSQLWLKFNRNWKLALAAYNWGQGNLMKLGIEKAPAETKRYYSSILTDIGIA